MSSTNFTIVYDGPGLRDHAMDVKDLAPAMLGLGQMFDAANAALNGEHVPIKVQVKATGPGSFEIAFDVIQSVGEQMLALLTSQPVAAAGNLVTLLTGVGALSGAGAGLFWLIRKLKGGNPDRIESIDANTVRLVLGAERYDIPLALLRLYQDLAVRGAVARVVADPLAKDGIEMFEIREGRRRVVQVSKAEAPYFVRPAIPDTILIDEVRRSAFSIISLAFKEDNKWRLHDGTNAISAGIVDADFLSRVDANLVSFSKGDILICEVRVVQTQGDSGLRTEYTVIRVVEHRTAARQLPLPFRPAATPPPA